MELVWSCGVGVELGLEWVLGSEWSRCWCRCRSWLELLIRSWCGSRVGQIWCRDDEQEDDFQSEQDLIKEGPEMMVNSHLWMVKKDPWMTSMDGG